MATAQHVVFRPGEERLGNRYVWELPVRITHWVTAGAITVLFATGMFITFPVFTSYGEPYRAFLMGRVREVHFIAGYALALSFAIRGYWFFVGNKYARSGLPLVWKKSWWDALFAVTREHLSVRRGPNQLGHNAMAGFSYFVGVGGMGIFQIITGFALYGETNPGGFWDQSCGWIIPLLGGSFRTHMWHHLVAWGFVAFTIAHLYFVFFESLRFREGLVSSIVSGDKFFREGDEDA
jgi:Ni/Fe-hydrogenase 1 B-type cytochrome subunit